MLVNGKEYKFEHWKQCGHTCILPENHYQSDSTFSCICRCGWSSADFEGPGWGIGVHTCDLSNLGPHIKIVYTLLPHLIENKVNQYKESYLKEYIKEWYWNNLIRTYMREIYERYFVK